LRGLQLRLSSAMHHRVPWSIGNWFLSRLLNRFLTSPPGVECVVEESLDVIGDVSVAVNVALSVAVSFECVVE